MSDLTKREDAIGACSYETIECYEARKAIRALPSADRPQDDDWEKYSDKLWKNAYERGKEEEHRWWTEHCANCTDADRPQGEWIYCEDEYGIDGYRCSNCGKHIPWDYQHKFINFIDDYHTCPFCDARMKGVDDE